MSRIISNRSIKIDLSSEDIETDVRTSEKTFTARAEIDEARLDKTAVMRLYVLASFDGGLAYKELGWTEWDFSKPESISPETGLPYTHLYFEAAIPSGATDIKQQLRCNKQVKTRSELIMDSRGVR